MPTRRLPNSGASRLHALQAGKERKDAVPPPAVIPYSAGTITRLDAFYPAFKLKIEAMEAALQAQSNVSGQVKTTRPDAEMLISHFYQALQNAIRRKIFDTSVRAFYGLAVSDGTVPSLKSEADIVFWGDKAAMGEAARIAAGGAAIPFPSIAEVNTAVGAFKTDNQQQANAKDAYDTTQETVEADSPEADKLILKMWNETEAAFDEGNKSSMRRKAREWGVVYVQNPDEVLSPDEFSIVGTVTDSISGLPVSNAAVVVQSPEIILLTDSQGKYFVPVLPAGSYNLFVHKDGYMEQTMGSVVVTAGAITTANFQLVAGSGSGLGKVAGQVNQAGVGVSGTVSVQGAALSVATDPMGNYIINDVPIGAQVLVAFVNSDPATTQPQNALVTEDETVTVNFNFA